MQNFVIANINDEALKWSNTDGWTDENDFDIFTLEEVKILNLPIEGKWQQLRAKHD
jgi:hypothetical protein